MKRISQINPSFAGWLRVVGSLWVLAGLTLNGCASNDGDTQYRQVQAEQCAGPWTGTAEASSAAKDLGVDTYEFSANRDAGTGQVILGGPSGEAKGTYAFDVQVDSLQPLVLTASSRLKRDGQTVASREGTVRELAGGGGVAKTRYSAGDLIEHRWFQVDRQGAIQSMTFGHPLESGEMAAGVRESGPEGAFDVVRLDFVDDFEPSDVTDWRESVGIQEALQSGDSRLFRTVASDRAWMESLAKTWKACAARVEDGETSTAQAPVSRRSALEGDGSDAWQRKLASCHQSAGESMAKMQQITSVAGALIDGVGIAGAMAAGGGAGAATVASAPLATPVLAAAGVYVASNIIGKAAGPVTEGGLRAAGKDEAADFFFGGGNDGSGDGSGGQGGGLGGATPANSTGDPHLVTLDGLAYDLQAVGEFVWARAHSGEPWEVQVRQQPVPSDRCPTVTYNRAVATELGGVPVGIYQGRSPPVVVDGSPAGIVGGVREVGQGGVIVEEEENEQYRLSWETGESLTVELQGNHLNLNGLTVPDSRRGQIHGLVGTSNGTRSDDLALRDGTVLSRPVRWDALHGPYADSWRVTQSSSLFDYASGTSTQDYTDRTVPQQPMTVESVPSSERPSARQTCRDAGVDSETLLEDCIVDVYCSGSSSYAQEHAARSEPDESASVERPLLFGDWFRVGTGDWSVEQQGRSVFQSTNPWWGEGRDNHPGMYISSQSYFDSTIRGSFEVETGGDGDWIGFVFGHQSPLESDGPDSYDYDMFVFSWKKNDERGSKAGYALYHVDGTVEDALPVFTRIGQMPPSTTEVLATDFGSDKGWTGHRRYDFGLTYTEDLIEISVDGEIIFSIEPSQSPVPFEEGRFGFYNLSQSQVRYSDFQASPAREDLRVDTFEMPLFPEDGELTPTGSASLAGDHVRLTASNSDQAGAAWFRGRPDISGGFDTSVEFNIDQGASGQGESGGNGLALVVHNAPDGFRQSPGSTSGPGYDGIVDSMAIELDVLSDYAEENGNHVAVHASTSGANGSGAPSRVASEPVELPSDLVDSGRHRLDVVYRPPTQMEDNLRIRLDGREILSTSIDLQSRLGLSDGRAYVGLTAATSSAAARHRVFRWDWTSQ